MDSILMIAGLGNPGTKYAKNRHNVGFLVVDALLNELGNSSYKKDSGGEYARLKYEGTRGFTDLVLYKPMKFMNLSGVSLIPAMRFFKVKTENLLVIHDEIELPFGEIRLKKGGGHKGHNGLRDIIGKGGSPEFHRLRMGVGRPEHADVAGYVLSDFSKEEQSRFDDFLSSGIRHCREWIESRSGG